MLAIDLDWILSLFDLPPTNLHLELLEEDKRLLLGNLQLVRFQSFRSKSEICHCFLLNQCVGSVMQVWQHAAAFFDGKPH